MDGSGWGGGVGVRFGTCPERAARLIAPNEPRSPAGGEADRRVQRGVRLPVPPRPSGGARSGAAEDFYTGKFAPAIKFAFKLL